jgi:hypothetical protein
MRVKPREKGKVISSCRRLVGLALLQDTVRLGFNQLADGEQTLFCRSFGSVSQGHAMQSSDKTIGPLHMFGLILQQGGAGLSVKSLHETHIHIRNVVQGLSGLRKDQGSGKSEPFWLCQIVH